MKKSLLALVAKVALPLLAAQFVSVGLAVPEAHAKDRTMPEDILKGRVIISDKRLPMKWSSVGEYVSQLKGLNKSTLWYDKQTGKLKIEYAAFFAKGLEDRQVELVIYDITNGAKNRRATTEQFMQRGDRVLFNSIEIDKEDIEMNKKYRIAIEDRRVTIASGEFILRGEGPHYSGHVEFTDEETKKKD